MWRIASVLVFASLCACGPVAKVSDTASSSGSTGSHGSTGTNGTSGTNSSTSNASSGSSGSHSSSSSTSTSNSSSTNSSSGGNTSGHSNSSSTSSTGNSSTASGSSGSSGSSGTSGTTAWSAGQPGTCVSQSIPANGQPVDTSNPTTVVGDGTAQSCTSSALSAAVAQGGIITFNCGSSPITIPITSTLTPPIDHDTVIDGNRLITLDGQNQVQIINFNSPNFQALDTVLTLQHLTLINGKTTPTDAIPPAPAPCSQGWDDGEGGAVYMRDGNLVVIDCVFQNNHAAPLGPDTGGGAIYVLGSKHGATIVDSTFDNNQASNAGAVGGLFCELDIYNSVFTNNQAIGNGANSDDASQCSVINNGQHEVGSGGNGGAIYSDGNDVNIFLCGDEIENNAAGQGAFGGGVFFTSDNFGGTLTILDTTMTGNTGGHWTSVSTGSTTNAGTAVGTNCKSLTISNSTVQGYP
jgi:hypothetical protein